MIKKLIILWLVFGFLGCCEAEAYYNQFPKLPSATQVALLTIEFQKYQKLAQSSWPQLRTYLLIKKGMHHSSIPMIRSRLQLLGDLSQDSPIYQKKLYDKSLYLAVLHFQHRHGLQPDGVIGPKTLERLNISPTQRLQQILINIRRWQKFLIPLPEQYIWVNVPNYELDVVKNNDLILNIHVIVGKSDRQTPEISSKINTIITNPTWTVPDSIIKKDLIPKILEDRNYLNKKNIHIYKDWSDNSSQINPKNINWVKLKKMDPIPYRFTQAPGKNNALGRLKFVFSNTQSIYLHDTPEKNLFDEEARTLSSGCIRLKDPVALMNYILRLNQNISSTLVEKNLNSGITRYFNLVHPIPIFLTYFTAWIDLEGNLEFRDDIYLKDQLTPNNSSQNSH